MTDPKAAPAAQKVQLHLVPPIAIHLEAVALEVGAKKYGAYNWRQNKVVASTYISAALRHIQAWQDGQNYDAEGAHHLAAARASFAIMLDADKYGNLIDDRIPKSPIKFT